ncbi:hypothetical protein HaLaN_29687 [Haematococcus lacustris]|uniref:Uncharacterized protein n=1 Tax=Haematococcus lacustris TaxID=44745 RepID=A0A6A0AD32_HAELA|nr:hypothetical protein HaLaN_29687 [Haematococcus lacustris]
MGRACAICGGRSCSKTLWRASWRSPSYPSAIIRRSPTCVELHAFPRYRNPSQEEKVKRGLSSPYKGHGAEQSQVVQQLAISLAVPSNPIGLQAGTESHASLQQRNQWHQLQGQQQGQQQERQQGHQQERQQGQQQGWRWEEQQQPAVETAPSSLAVPAFLHHPPAQRPRLSVLQAAMALAAVSHNQQAEATLAPGGDIPGQRAVLPQLLGGLLTRLTAIPGFRELAAGLQQLSGSLSDALPRSSPVLADAGCSPPPGRGGRGRKRGRGRRGRARGEGHGQGGGWWQGPEQAGPGGGVECKQVHPVCQPQRQLPCPASCLCLGGGGAALAAARPRLGSGGAEAG